MKKKILKFLIFCCVLFPMIAVDYSQKHFPQSIGYCIQEDGTTQPLTNSIRLKKNKYSSENIAELYDLTTTYFYFDNQEYIILSNQYYDSYLFKATDFKTFLYSNQKNVNIIPAQKLLSKETYGELSFYEIEEILNSSDSELSKFLNSCKFEDNFILFTEFCTEKKGSLLFSDYFFSNNGANALLIDSEYPETLSDKYYFAISEKNFSNFFNATILEEKRDIIEKYNYDLFSIYEDYDKYEDIKWLYSVSQYKMSNMLLDTYFYIGIFPSEKKSFRFYLGTGNCNKYYDCIEKVLIINENNERFELIIPYQNTEHSYGYTSFDVYISPNDISCLEEVLLGENIEIALYFENSPRQIIKVNKAKRNEFRFMIKHYNSL